MSRFMLSCSLVLALSSAAFGEAHFARPPETMDLMPTSRAVAAHCVLDRAAVRDALVRARATNLSSFLAYQKKGVFPSNTYANRKLNVWLDDAGHFCAAATMIKMSGQDDLVLRTAEQNNFIRLADIAQGPLMDWILTSGFTQEEIAMIQEPFLPVVDEPALSEPSLVDAELRKAEDARLRTKYRAVTRLLVKQQRKSLDIAVDRLMAHQELAWQLLAG